MRGACVVDRRPRSDGEGAAAGGAGGGRGEYGAVKGKDEGAAVGGGELEDDEQVASRTKAGGADEGGWLGGRGNQVWVVSESGWQERFGEVMMRRILGLDLD
jgi:hypothetical protein